MMVSGASKVSRIHAVVLLLCLVAACAAVPKDIARPRSTAWSRPDDTRLGRELAPHLVAHPGESAFYILSSGLDAFVARALLAETAEKTLDVQYYIFHSDLTGKILLDRMLSAADRGVRVRLLVDDMYTAGKDKTIAALASHPNFEIRVFNPFAGRSAFSRMFDWVTDFSRVNRRMHNKMFVADGAIGIVGGRNVGDEYFAAREDVNFADLDLLAAGPVVSELGNVFDAYWNSAFAFPIEAFVPDQPSPAELEAVSRALADHREATRDTPYAVRLRESDIVARLREGKLPFLWGRARVVYDQPEKIGSGVPHPEEGTWWGSLRSQQGEVRSELILVSPYFVPGAQGVTRFAELRKDGVRIRILTNSLASNDVSSVHAGYRKYREGLLREGVELYEIRPFPDLPGETREQARKRFGSSGASLHAKTMVFDRRTVFVGSANLDPRSAHLNTELGIVITSPELARRIAAIFEAATDPKYAFHLALQPAPDSAGDTDGSAGEEIVWIGEEDGKEVVFHQEPDASFWKRLSVWIQSALAPESLL
ncbi:MAG: phospholipase D family protein [Verrucomicrobiota bacterium]